LQHPYSGRIVSPDVPKAFKVARLANAELASLGLGMRYVVDERECEYPDYFILDTLTDTWVAMQDLFDMLKEESRMAVPHS